ncbi:hypothetical protein ANCCEY_13591 [Ancylostoma ceylanicum]|uniref:THIF-type NAD/FAD binding fold domain-containing protein n=1 Tax=Ancylostoma ceylanicum TaxID=53326 RepID=A0A0D6LI89_9BILA|nr:hypothetical protein ANCCEY_13591 [Ancylostoma ceylanicum]
MLCGIRSLTLVDERNVTEDDLDSNFLLENDSAGKNRARASSQKARALNPMVKLEVLEASVGSLSTDFVSNFTLVVLCDQKYSDVVTWNEKCRQLNIGSVEKKEGAVCDGDSGGTSSAPEAIDVDAENVLEKKKYQYPSIEEAFSVDWSKKQLVRKSRRVIPCSYFPLKAMLRAQKEEKLCADEDKNIKILTELWTEEAMSENGRPLRNIFIYSALDSTGTMCMFPPP